MKRHLTAEELALYSEYVQSGEKTEIAEDILTHINECDECASEAVEFSMLSKDILTELSDKKPVAKKRSLLFVIAGIAATLLLIYGVWQIFELRINKNDIKIAGKNPPVINDTTNVSDTSVQEIPNPVDNKHEMLASNFAKDPETEKIIENLKGNMRSDEIEVISGFEIKSQTGRDISLYWENNNGNKLNIEIYTNALVKTESAEISGNSYVIKSKLNPGLYYWKLFNEDFDLIFCGRIIVE